jgi:chemotaxis protein MotB
MTEHDDLLEDEGAGYLIAVSDMMSGLLFIFIITLVAFILNFQDAINKQTDITEKQSEAIERQKEATAKQKEVTAKQSEAIERQKEVTARQQEAIEKQKEVTAIQKEATVKQKEVTETQKSIVRKLTNTDKVRTELLLNIKDELARQNIIIEVDTQHGVLRLTEQAVLFETAQDSLGEASQKNLQTIGGVMSRILPCYSIEPPKSEQCMGMADFKGMLDSIFVEGHTDNVPINSRKYKNNWVLSAQRAISAYSYLVPNTILENMENTSSQPVFSVSGYGAGRPVEGHKYSVATADPANRRIDIRFIMTPPSLTVAQESLIKQGIN